MSVTFNNADEVWDFMDDQIQTLNFRGEPQEFVPKLAFDRVTTKEVVKIVVHEEQDFLLSGQKLDNFIDQVYAKARIMFATCTYAKLSMNVLEALLDKGLTDASLPLTREACNNEKLKKHIRRFNDNLKRIRTVYFKLNSYHRSLEGYTKPINLDERNVLGKGAFGDVYNIEIHPEHRSFSSGANKKGEFALKVTQQEGRELNFHTAMAKLAHPHLLKCLASFTFSSKYHMIYEKADYDVEGFMEQHQNAQGLDSFSGSDLAAQLHGLAAALLVIHNQENGDLDLDPSRLGIPQDKPAQSGYIHDIKPDNLLLFIYKHNGRSKYWFRLSDFSCAKVVDFVHRVSGKRRSYLSDNKAGNPTYRAPEMWKKLGTSRPYDLWSLGCVYLELLVWYMDGFQTLTEFRDARLFQVHPGGMEDDGFCFTNEADTTVSIASTATYHLRKAVVEKMTELSNRCTGSLKDIADVIPKLLEIEPKKRLTAEQLVEKLKHLDTGELPPFDCEQPDSFATSDIAVSSTPADDSDSDFSSLDGFFTVTKPSQ